MRKRTVFPSALVVAVLTAAAAAQEVRLLNGFNSTDEMNRFGWSSTVKAELTVEHRTEGTHAVQVTFPGGLVKYGGFGIRTPEMMTGWDRWDLLTFDVHNPTRDLHTVVIRIDDDRTDKSDWATWYTGTFKVFPGANHIEIEIAKLNKPHAGTLRTDKLTQLALWTKETKEAKTLVFDNVALRKFAVTTLPKGLRGFDFGTADSAVWPGFTRVEAKEVYTDARGWGLNEGRSGYEDAPRAVEGLGKDSVGTASGTPLVFTLKLPDGRYSVWAATGYIDPYNWPRKPYTVSLNGRVVFEHKPKSLDPLEAADYLGRDYSRAADLWKTVAAGHLFDEFVTDLTVRGGKLEVVVASEGAPSRLRALAVWPADDRECEKTMVQIHAARREAFDKQWRELRPAKAPAPPRVMPDEFNRGFFLSRQNLLDEITPYHRPVVEDRLTRASIAATPGEIAPVAFVVYPLRNIPHCTVSVKPLTGPAGAVIPAANVQVNTVQYRYAREGEDAWRVQQGHLAPRAELALEPNVPRQFWLEVQVPDDAKPGVYTGSVVVSGGGANVTGFVLALDVYPFTLDRPEDHGVVYAHASRITGDARWIENDLRCLVRYGCNSITPSGVIGGRMQDTGGKSDFTFDRLDLVMDLMKKVGMTGPVPLFDQSIQGYAGGASRWHVGWQVLDEEGDWAANMTRLTRQILDRAKEKDYLPVLMYPSTEISNDPGLGPRMNSLIIKAIRAAGDCRCISSVNRPEDIVTAKELDHVMLNFGAGIDQQTLDRVHASGAKLWFQNVGQTRYVDGFFMLRAGAIGHRQWVANWPSADPYNDWDGGESNSMLFPSPVGTLPSVRLAQMAEGVKDMRYFLTLRRLIAEARKAGHAAAADAAQKEVDAMIATCPVQLPDGTRVFEDGLSVIEGFRDPETFDLYRQRAAAQIFALRAVLGGR